MRLCLYAIIVISLSMHCGLLPGQEVQLERMTDSTAVYRMNEIIVTADRAELVSSFTFKEISAKQIAPLDSKTPADVFKFAPGLHVYKTSTNQTTFMLRGFEQRQVSVFLDGIPVSVPYDGTINLDQLAGGDLEKIRISRGATSALYGANTIGGSVNIITSAFEQPQHFSLRLEGSTYSAYFANLMYHNQIGKLKFRLNASYDQSDDFPLSSGFKPTVNEQGLGRDNSDYQKISFGAKLQYKFDQRHHIGLTFNQIDNEYNIPPNSKMQRVRYWQFPEWRKSVISLHSEHFFSGRFLLRSVFFYDTYYNLLESFDDDNYTTQEQRWAWNSIYDDHSLGFYLFPSLSMFRFGSTNFVLSYKNDLHKEKLQNAQDPESGFDAYALSTLTTGFEQDIRVSETHQALLGFDVQHLEPGEAAGTTKRKVITLFNGQGAWQYRFTEEDIISISAGKKSRFPTLKELYSERLGRTIPNPDLKPEHAYNTELSFQRNLTNGYFMGTVFYNTLFDLINTRELGDETEQLQNIGKAVLRGFEFDFGYNSQKILARVNYTLLDAKNLSAQRTSDFLPNRPAHRINLFVQYYVFAKLAINFESNLVYDQHYEHPETLEWQALNDYTLFNLRINYAISRGFDWYLRSDNITDVNYESDYGVPMPGRTIAMGIKARL